VYAIVQEYNRVKEPSQSRIFCNQKVTSTVRDHSRGAVEEKKSATRVQIQPKVFIVSNPITIVVDPVQLPYDQVVRCYYQRTKCVHFHELFSEK
jgi:hypothetical protein